MQNFDTHVIYVNSYIGEGWKKKSDEKGMQRESRHAGEARPRVSSGSKNCQIM